MLAEAIDATRTQVVAALRQASAATGSDFDYLLGTAMRESRLKPAAQAATSSASVSSNFTQQTGLGMVKQHGAQFGLGSYANAVTPAVNAPAHDDSFACQLWDATDPDAASLIGGVGHGRFALAPGIVHVLASLSPEEHDDLN